MPWSPLVKCGTCGSEYYHGATYHDFTELDDGTIKCVKCIRKEMEVTTKALIIKGGCYNCPMHSSRLVPDYGDKHRCTITGEEHYEIELVFIKCSLPTKED